MKRKDLERKLKDCGWWFKRHGGNHDIWTDGNDEESIPRHNEIDNYLAKKIIKKLLNPNNRKYNHASRWKNLEK